MSYQYLSETSPLNSVSVIGFTTLAQSLINSQFETFGEIAKSLALTIFLNFQESNIIAVITDWYDVKDSIKFYERSQREKKPDFVVIDIVTDVQKLSKCMTDFLTNSSNKHDFIKYFFLMWQW